MGYAVVLQVQANHQLNRAPSNKCPTRICQISHRSWHQTNCLCTSFATRESSCSCSRWFQLQTTKLARSSWESHVEANSGKAQQVWNLSDTELGHPKRPCCYSRRAQFGPKRCPVPQWKYKNIRFQINGWRDERNKQTRFQKPHVQLT